MLTEIGIGRPDPRSSSSREVRQGPPARASATACTRATTRGPPSSRRPPTRCSRSPARTRCSTSPSRSKRSRCPTTTSSRASSTRTSTSTRASSTRRWASRWRCSRCCSPSRAPPGWLAHWVELLEQDQKIARPRQLYTGTARARLRRPRQPVAAGRARGHDRRWRARVAGAPRPRAGRGRDRGRGAGGRHQQRRPPAARRLLPPPPGAPADIPGLEAAGEVVALGPGCHRFAVGDRVMAVLAGGGQAERFVVHERAAIPVPPRCRGSRPARSRRTSPPPTTRCSPRPGCRWASACCVHGAAGGVGTAAVLLGVARRAPPWWPPCATRRSEPAVEALAPGVRAIPQDGFEQHGPFDVILELVGAPNLPATSRRSPPADASPSSASARAPRPR